MKTVSSVLLIVVSVLFINPLMPESQGGERPSPDQTSGRVYGITIESRDDDQNEYYFRGPPSPHISPALGPHYHEKLNMSGPLAAASFEVSEDTVLTDTLRVFTYNIRYGRGLDDKVDIRRIAEVIRKKDPHVVALQEIDVGVERSGRIDIMAVLSGYLSMEPVFYKNILHQGGEYGNGILSRLPLLSSRNLRYVQAEGEQRGLLQVEIDFNGVTIALMNTHLDNRYEEDRLAAVDQIIETKRAYRGSPVVVTGDFNDVPGSPTYERMNEYFTDVWEEHGEGDGFTIPPSHPDRRIDYFFYTNDLVEEGEPHLRAIKMEVIDSEASDHLPIYAEFEVVR